MGDLPLRDHFELYYHVAGASLKLDMEILGLKIQGASILDIGCGPGALLKSLKDSGATVEGFDLDPHVIEYGKKFISEISVGDALDHSSPLGNFDYILMGCVLPHLSDPVAFLKSLHSRMNMTQKLVLTLPNLDQCFDYSPGPFYEFLHIGHIHYFNSTTIERCANSSGFIVDQIIPRGAAMVVLLTKTIHVIPNINNAFQQSLSAVRFSDFRYREIDKPIQKILRSYYRNPRRLIRIAIAKLRQALYSDRNHY
jgi:2-polyprenyl-3-methyl-5-hydroxy-6-metoxy-1,4-benzoquinol methylase